MVNQKLKRKLRSQSQKQLTLHPARIEAPVPIGTPNFEPKCHIDPPPEEKPNLKLTSVPNGTPFVVLSERE